MNGTIVNRAFPSLHGGSLEITLTILLSQISVFWISVIFEVVTLKHFTRKKTLVLSKLSKLRNELFTRNVGIKTTIQIGF